MRSMDQYMKRIELEKEEGWDSFTNLPSFSIPAGVKVQIIPPTAGAFARLVLWKGDRRLSIYFDAVDALGSVGQPYYEIYPNAEHDTSRYLAGEEDQMAEEIAAIFSETADV